jgi:hypothetical protein
MLWPVAVAAHPCDVVPPASGAVATGVDVVTSWCQPQADVVYAATVYRNGLATTFTAWEVVTPTASASGKVQYRVPLGVLADGVYAVEVTASNGNGESAKSAVFTLTVGAPPSASGCFDLEGYGYDIGAEIARTVEGNPKQRNQYTAAMSDRGWALLSTKRVSKRWSLHFRCEGE